MPRGSNPELAREFAAALDWWRDAGVDCDFVDEPRSWLEPVGAETLPAGPATASAMNDGVPAPPSGSFDSPRALRTEPAAPAIVPENIPDDLESFREWWMREPALDEGRTGQRIPPRGERGAELMVLVPEPEAMDRDRLLSGPQGRLLEGFLQAAGLDPATVYHASFLPRHGPGTDWNGPEPAAIAPAVLRHIALAAPKRLLVLGFNVLPLLGNAPPQAPASLQNLQHEGMTIPLLAARALAGMDQRPSWKAALWQAWLDWHRA